MIPNYAKIGFHTDLIGLARPRHPENSSWDTTLLGKWCNTPERHRATPEKKMHSTQGNQEAWRQYHEKYYLVYPKLLSPLTATHNIIWKQCSWTAVGVRYGWVMISLDILRDANIYPCHKLRWIIWEWPEVFPFLFTNYINCNCFATLHSQILSKRYKIVCLNFKI